MRKRFLILSLAVCGLTACAATSNNPKEGGFIGGLIGLSNGSYETRVNQRQDELRRRQEINQDLQKQARDLESEAQMRENDVALERMNLEELERAFTEFETELSRLSEKSSKQKGEIAALKIRVEEQRKKLISQKSTLAELDLAGGKDVDPEGYRILELERKRLAEEFELLIEYSRSLSNAVH